MNEKRRQIELRIREGFACGEQAELMDTIEVVDLAEQRPRLSSVQAGRISPPDTIDVGMVAPKGPGHLLRSVYEAGGGESEGWVAPFALCRRTNSSAAP